MSRNDPERAVQQSIMERLVDLSRDSVGDPQVSRAESIRRLKVSLRRDLEWLLNTRRSIVPIPDSYSELASSVFAFGMPDITSLRVDTAQDEKRLLAALELAISRFEPRLTGIRVRSLERPRRGRLHTMHFQIEGMLEIEPAPEHISFDTVLEVASGEYAIKGESGA